MYENCYEFVWEIEFRNWSLLSKARNKLRIALPRRQSLLFSKEFELFISSSYTYPTVMLSTEEKACISEFFEDFPSADLYALALVISKRNLQPTSRDGIF